MKVLQAKLQSFTTPPDLVFEAAELSEPGENQVLVEMAYSPINPADLNILEGKYGELPVLPAVVGNEGVGRVVKGGAAVASLPPGTPVVTLTLGNWASHRLLNAEDVIPLPDLIDLPQAAMLSVNPPTAWGLLHDFVDLAPGDWIVQNAANSGVGQCVIQLARHFGWRTLNVVRRPELIPALQELGADVVVEETVDLREAARSLTGGSMPRIGLNAVGGASALNVANALAAGSALVTYGAMGRQPIKIPNSLLIFKNLRFCGFWLRQWMRETDPSQRSSVFSTLADLVKRGELKQPVQEIYPLQEVIRAWEAANRDKRQGKILLDLQK